SPSVGGGQAGGQGGDPAGEVGQRLVEGRGVAGGDGVGYRPVDVDRGGELLVGAVAHADDQVAHAQHFTHVLGCHAGQVQAVAAGHLEGDGVDRLGGVGAGRGSGHRTRAAPQ